MKAESVTVSIENEDLTLVPSGDPGVQLENVPGVEEIRLRAYQKYIERGGIDGQDLDDWLLAEQELVQTATAEQATARPDPIGESAQAA
jgi:hypothetical protein